MWDDDCGDAIFAKNLTTESPLGSFPATNSAVRSTDDFLLFFRHLRKHGQRQDLPAGFLGFRKGAGR